jgi:hypothetical protein
MANRLSPLERARDRNRHGRWRVSGHTLQVVAGSGSSDAAISWLRSRILPGVLREPAQWLFLVQGSSGHPGGHEADQYSVVEHVARRLRIPVVRDLFLPLADERVIAAAARRRLPPGTTIEDLYGALCYDYLPRSRTGAVFEKGLRAGEIHGVVHARWEALRIQREMRWLLAWPRLLGIVSHLLERLEHERPGALDEYYVGRLRRALKAAALSLNRERLRVVLAQHPERRQVLVLLDDANLPVILPRMGDSVG